MSKSYGNSIYLEDTEAEITKKIATMVTDTRRVRRTDPGEPNDCPVFALHKIFSTPAEQADCAEGCRSAGIGCFDCKKVLIRHVLETVLPVGEKVRKLKSDGDYLRDVLKAGAEKARAVAAATMDEVRSAMNLKGF